MNVVFNLFICYKPLIYSIILMLTVSSYLISDLSAVQRQTVLTDSAERVHVLLQTLQFSLEQMMMVKRAEVRRSQI